MKYQDFCKMLNYGLSNGMIDGETAVRLMCNEMPLSLHKGSWSIIEKGGLMVRCHRLVCWYDCREEGKIELCDLYVLLAGN